MKESPIRVLCLFNRLLGNKEYSLRLEESLQGMSGIETTFWYFDWQDYEIDYKVPYIFQQSAVIESAMITRKKYSSQIKDIQEKYDALFFVTYWLPIGFYKDIKAMPTIVALDSNPTLSHHLLRKIQSSIFDKIRSYISYYVTSRLYRWIFKRVDVFMPYSEWCANSLVKDYSVSKNKIHVSYYPLDTDLWRPKPELRSQSEFRLLFVGNDFIRKGGEFMLKLFSEHLSDFCQFIIVSNDNYLIKKSLPPKVKLISGLTHDNLDELVSIYQSSHLFVLPTRRDQLPQVIIESMASGLPVIATDIGGIHNLVENDVNGYLMAEGSTVIEWAEKIKFLFKNPQVHNLFSTHCRQTVLEKCSFSNFDAHLKDIIEKISSQVENNRREFKFKS